MFYWEERKSKYRMHKSEIFQQGPAGETIKDFSILMTEKTPLFFILPESSSFGTQ